MVTLVSGGFGGGLPLRWGVLASLSLYPFGNFSGAPSERMSGQPPAKVQKTEKKAAKVALFSVYDKTGV